jgi:hypothetical protein
MTDKLCKDLLKDICSLTVEIEKACLEGDYDTAHLRFEMRKPVEKLFNKNCTEWLYRKEGALVENSKGILPPGSESKKLFWMNLEEF